jgi:hypothetical protein
MLSVLREQVNAARDLTEILGEQLDRAEGIHDDRAARTSLHLAQAVAALQRALTNRGWWWQPDPPQN